jgi:hypothetical protein
LTLPLPAFDDERRAASRAACTAGSNMAALVPCPVVVSPPAGPLGPGFLCLFCNCVATWRLIAGMCTRGRIVGRTRGRILTWGRADAPGTLDPASAGAAAPISAVNMAMAVNVRVMASSGR